MSSGYEIPKTLAERNEGLTDFWDKGYNFGLETAIGQIRGEARWQYELKLRHDPAADAVIDRLVLLANLLEGLMKPIPESGSGLSGQVPTEPAEEAK